MQQQYRNYPLAAQAHHATPARRGPGTYLFLFFILHLLCLDARAPPNPPSLLAAPVPHALCCHDQEG